MIVLVLVSIVLLCAYMKFRWSRRRMYELARGVPDVATALPLIGHAHHFFGDTVKLFRTLIKFAQNTNRHQGISKLWVGPELYYVMSDPEDVTTALNVCLEKNYVYNFFRPWLGDGLITSNEQVWKYRHKKLYPAFNQKVLNDFIPIFNKQSALIIEGMERERKNEWFNPDPYIAEATLEMICQTAMGAPPGQDKIMNLSYLKAAQVAESVIAERVLKVWLYPDFMYRLSGYQKIFDDAVKIMKNVSNTIVQRKRAEYENKFSQKSQEKTGKPFRAFLDLMLEFSNDDSMFTDESIREEVDTLIIAGQGTVAYTTHFALLLLGTYPNKQEKLFNELTDIFGESDRCVTREDLIKLVYLEAVVNETLRLYPGILIIARLVRQELKLKTCSLPKGSNIVVSNWALHHHERWGADYDSFRPERWFEPDCPSKVPGAFCPFGAGKRMCIGKSYAMMAIKTMLVHILRKYVVHADIKQLVLKFDIVLRQHAGNSIKIEKRYK